MVEVIEALPNLNRGSAGFMPAIHSCCRGVTRPSAANSSLATEEVANPAYAFDFAVLNANRTRAVALLLE